MNLDKAIIIKSREGEELLHTDPDELAEADRLSIEALERCLENRTAHRDHLGQPLPGETKK